MRHWGTKSQSLTPVVYEYRKPHLRGKPGYYSLKSFYTTGCYPSGLEVPYRLNDFHKSYLSSYLPEELEEWLQEVRPSAIEAAHHSLKVLMEELSNFTLGQPTRWRPKPMLTHLDRISQPLEDVINAFVDENIHREKSRFYPFVQKKTEQCGRVKLPNVLTRHLLNNHFSELTEVVEVLGEAWSAIGSTPHQRSLSKIRHVQNLFDTKSEIPQSSLSTSQVTQLADAFSPQLPQQVLAQTNMASLSPVHHLEKDILSSPSNDITYEDELLLMHLHNLVARAARETQEYDVGISVSQVSLFSLAHDDIRAAKAHGDLASLWLDKGDYDTAIIHAQRAVILGEYGSHTENTPDEMNSPETLKLALLEHKSDKFTKDSVVSRGYVLWSSALAQQDHLDDALSIAVRGYESQPTSQSVRENLRKLQRFSCGRITTPLSRRSICGNNAEKNRHGVDSVPFRLVHHSIVNRSNGYQWIFWNHPMDLKYKYDPRGF